MFKSNAQYYIKETISSTATNGATFKISTDFELWLNLETWTDNVSVKLVNWTQIERMTITATWWVATIVQRWLTQADTKVEDVNLQKTWNDGTIMTIVALASDMLDIDKSSGITTISADLKMADSKKMYFWDNAYVTTTNNGTDLILKDWNNAEVSLSQITTWTGTDHKVLTSSTDTTASFLNNKLTAWNWISKNIVNPWVNETLNYDIDLADTTIFATDWTANRVAVTDVSGNLFQATTTKRGWVELSTDAEALAWTDETRYINPKQLHDNLKDNIWDFVSINNGTAYQAVTSWIVQFYATWYNTLVLYWYFSLDWTNWTAIAAHENNYWQANRTASITFPVKKWMYYKCTAAAPGYSMWPNYWYFIPFK